MEKIDISAAVVLLIMAFVLVSVKIPNDERWRAIRRMNRLLFACYICIGVSNIITGVCGVDTQPDPVMWLAMLLVSMYQAFLFTGTCVTFLSPQRVGVKWLLVNAVVITLVNIASFWAFFSNERSAAWISIVDAVLYSAQLVYYCYLFRKAYVESRRCLEASYDEDMSARLRWITMCFISALTVGICALLFAVLRLGATEYAAFTCIATVYYVYLVICMINYRIRAGFIVKVVAAAPTAQTAESSAPVESMDSAEEHQLQAAIKKWVDNKRYVQDDQTVEEIAAELGTSHAMMKWYFTNRMHTTFRTWRIELRVAEAKRLLGEAAVSTAMVHKMVGIADKSNFHKHFQKYVGMTPREYQVSMKQGKG